MSDPPRSRPRNCGVGLMLRIGAEPTNTIPPERSSGSAVTLLPSSRSLHRTTRREGSRDVSEPRRSSTSTSSPSGRERLVRPLRLILRAFTPGGISSTRVPTRLSAPRTSSRSGSCARLAQRLRTSALTAVKPSGSRLIRVSLRSIRPRTERSAGSADIRVPRATRSPPTHNLCGSASKVGSEIERLPDTSK